MNLLIAFFLGLIFRPLLRGAVFEWRRRRFKGVVISPERRYRMAKDGDI